MTRGPTIEFDELVHYCATAGRKCFAAYSPEVLRDYIGFHVLHDSLRFVRQAGQLVGVGIAWRLHRSVLALRVTGDRPVFDWEPDNPAGDTLFVADFVCTHPAALANLIRAFTLRYPNCGQLNWFTYRRGRLVPLHRATATRLLERQR